MSPEDSHHQQTPTAEVKPVSKGASAPVPAGPLRMPKINLSRTSSAFVAEYSIMLIMLTVALGGLTTLFYIFGGLILSTMHSATFNETYNPLSLMVIWVAVMSLVALPVTAVLWSRTQGEIAGSFNGDLPKGGARGFRTFWLVVSGISALLIITTALYTPIAAAIEGNGVVDMLLGVTLPSLLSAATIGVGIVIVTSLAARRRLIRSLLWGVVALTAVLVIVDFLWAINRPHAERRPYTPAQNSPYYEYDTPYNSYPYTN